MPKSSELAILVNLQDRVVGYKNVVDVHKNPAILHRAISVLIFNGDKVLLQKRSKEKFTWPHFWTNTCCTNVRKGETYLKAAKRALKWEMGIETKLKKAFKFSYSAVYNKEYGENEVDTVYFGKYMGEVKPNPNESEDYRWISLDVLKKDIKDNPDKYTPWFKIVMGMRMI